MSENVNVNKSTVAKKKRKFNVVDFFILVIIVALIAVIVYSFSSWSQIKKLWTAEEVTIDYTVELRGVDESFIDLIKKKDAVIDSVSKNSLGKVTTVESIKKSSVLGYKDGGETIEGILVEYPDKYDITVRITAKADYEKGVGYSVNGCRIAVGEEIFCRFPKLSCTGYCVGLYANS
jgi:hypothetical protein